MCFLNWQLKVPSIMYIVQYSVQVPTVVFMTNVVLCKLIPCRWLPWLQRNLLPPFSRENFPLLTVEVARFSGLLVPAYITTWSHALENSYLQISAVYSYNFLCHLQHKFSDIIISFPKESCYTGLLHASLVDVQVNLEFRSYLTSFAHFILAFI